MLYTEFVKPETFHSLDAKIKKLVMRYQKLERLPRRFSNGMALTSSEIHLFETIGDLPGISVTELARRHGISKGAVSQTLKRLDAKSMIEREIDPQNQSRIRLKLNEMGEKMHREHKDWHEKRLDGGLMDLMNELTEEEGQFLHRSFDRFNQVLQEMIRLNR